MSSVGPSLSYLYTGNPPVLTHHRANLERVINSIPKLDPNLSTNPVYKQSYKMLADAFEEYKRGLTLPMNSDAAIHAFSKSAKLYEGALDHLYDFEEFERSRRLDKHLDDVYNKVFEESMDNGFTPDEAMDDANFAVEEAKTKFSWSLFSIPPSQKIEEAKKKLKKYQLRPTSGGIQRKKRSTRRNRNRKTRKN
jgi:hypothetical protein